MRRRLRTPRRRLGQDQDAQRRAVGHAVGKPQEFELKELIAIAEQSKNGILLDEAYEFFHTSG